MTDKERGLQSAMIEERRKRQELERKLQELQQQPPQGEAKTFWDDPENALQSVLGQVSKAVTTTKMDTAEMIARSRYQDFDQKIDIFADILQNTPGLREQWMSAPDPAEFAYRTGDNFLKLQQAGNIDNMKANLEKEIRIKIEAEMKAKQEAEKAQRDAIPGSLSNVQSAPSPKAVWGGPPSLDNILKP
jgi:hypothetical protein